MSKPALTEKQAYWLNHIQQCEQKNLTTPVCCDQHDLKVSQFYSYKHELRRKGFLQALTEKQAYWLNHIQQCEQKNLTTPVCCDQHDLKVSQFYSYKHELRRKGFLQTESTTVFAKAIVKPPHKTATVRAHPVAFSLSVIWGTFRLQITTGGPLS